MAHRLLILKCYARKFGGEELLPTGERYNGPLWQVWRKFQREYPKQASEIEVYALTGAFGLIPATQLIPWVDQTMAPERADVLRPVVLSDFQTLMEQGQYTHLCLALSERYMRAMQGWEVLIPETTGVTQTDGPMGSKLAELRAWLRGERWQPLSPLERIEPRSPRKDQVVLAGILIRYTPDAVLALARQGLQDGAKGATRFRQWYVAVDESRVAPKWLVSRLSGLPVSAFDAADARRVLLALGIPIEHTPKDE